jgi:HPt (histidine-containing phosphotransfer) domain-containing protein
MSVVDYFHRPYLDTFRALNSYSAFEGLARESIWQENLKKALEPLSMQIEKTLRNANPFDQMRQLNDSIAQMLAPVNLDALGITGGKLEGNNYKAPIYETINIHEKNHFHGKMLERRLEDVENLIEEFGNRIEELERKSDNRDEPGSWC